MPRNLKDATYVKTFIGPAAAGSTQSASIDLSADAYKPETIEAELSVPALSDTIIGNTETARYIIETSTTSVFTAVDQTLTDETITATGSGVAATIKRVRLPSNCARYIRGRLTTGTGAATAAGVTSTFQLLF